MKRVSTFIAVLALGTLVFAQQSPTYQNQPAGQAGNNGAKGTTTGTAQGTAQPNAAQGGATQPQGKRPPQAKTQPEFEAYNAAIKATDATAMEKAADDFAAKFPDSELRVLLYRGTMRSYQSANNADKMQEVGHKVLALDPNDPEALIGVAEVMAERTRDTDIDKDQRLAEASKMARQSLETIDTDITVPAGTPQEKVDAYKNGLRSSAYSIIGTIQFNSEKYPDAEASFRKSIDAFPSQPDPVVVLRLALAIDKQGRYPDALIEANKAVQLTQENTNAGTVARRERDRLVQLTGGSIPTPASGTPAPTTPASNGQTTTPPKN